MTPRPEGAHVVDEHLFRFVTSLELKKAPRLQYPLAIVTILSTAVESAAPMARRMSSALRRSDLVGLNPSVPGVRLLLIDVGIEELEPVIRRVNEELADFSPVGFGTACFPATGSTLEELLTQADTRARAHLSSG
jgi:hypothetical protein